MREVWKAFWMRALASDEHQAMQHSQAMRNTIIWGVIAILAGAIVHLVLPLLAGGSGGAAASFEGSIISGFTTIEGWITVLAVPGVALVATYHALMRA